MLTRSTTDFDQFITVCMKNDTPQDVLYAIRCGWATNNEACNRRMEVLYNDRGNLRVFLIYSVNESKHFCALMEMTGPLDWEHHISGWSKPECRG